MFEYILAFVGGMMFGGIGLFFVIALCVASRGRHWRDK